MHDSTREKEKAVLTLFDYLRRRAFESVIDGTQDALEYLESQKHFDPSAAAENALARRGSTGSTQNDLTASENSSSGGGQGGEKLPPPRRRGRPRKNLQGEN